MKKNKFNQAIIAAILSVFSQSLVNNSLLADNGVKPLQNPNQAFVTPDYTGDFTQRNTISGDWGGYRQELANNGITLDANLTQVVQGVTSGGIKSGSEYVGRGETALNLDTAKMGFWPGGLLSVIGEGNFGDSLFKNTGSLIGTNLNEVLPEPEDSFVIPQVSFTQFLSPKFGLAIGKFATINDKGGDMNAFAHGKGNRQFLNLAFSVNPVTALTVPYSTLGTSAVYLPNEDLVIVANVIDPHGKAHSSGLESLFENGATFALEGRYTTDFFQKTGHQLLGTTYSTSSYLDLDQRVANLIIPALPIKEAQDSWSVYWNADQYIYQPDKNLDRGVGVFARFGLSDGEANPIRNFASAGLAAKGIIPNREEDSLGLGYFYTWIAYNRITSKLGFEDAQGFEAYYEIALTPAIYLSPDIQWVQPSERVVDSSWVMGARLYTIF